MDAGGNITGTRFTIQYVEAVDSTQDAVKRQLPGLAPYTVVWVDAQHAGRGRFQRRWRAAPGDDLTFSILLPLDDLPARVWPNISQVAALALVRSLEEYNLPLLVKWPNDVLIADKKFCGILCETGSAEGVSFAVLGVGINVNSGPDHLATIRPDLTSLKMAMGRALERRVLLEAYLTSFSVVWDTFRESGNAPVMQALRPRLAFKNQRICLEIGQEVLSGELRDVDDAGRLVLALPDGTERHLASGEILRLLMETS